MIVQQIALADWKSPKRRLKSVIAVISVTADGYPADEETRSFLLNAIHDSQLTAELAKGLTGGRQDLPGFQEAYYQQTFAAWYPNVEIIFIDDAGHFPTYETPLYLATIIEDFLVANSG